jgi:hypothetical protein
MNKLNAILQNVTGDRAVLKATVLYVANGREMTLDSYRADGIETVLEYADRIKFSDKDFADALNATGWGMTERPVKMGMSYRYILKRGAEIVYTANAASADERDLMAQRKVMRQIAVANEMDAELSGIN